MFRTNEYAKIKQDYDRISRAYFPRDYDPPADLRFAGSDALFPPNALATVLASEYEQQCRTLCYGVYPCWDDVLAGFEKLRTLL